MLRDFTGPIRSAAIAFVTVAAVGIAPLTACGVKGPLKLPPAPASGTQSSEPPAVPAPKAPAEAAPQAPATRP